VNRSLRNWSHTHMPACGFLTSVPEFRKNGKQELFSDYYWSLLDDYYWSLLEAGSLWIHKPRSLLVK
jgi:hypothetical protein